MSGQNSQSGFIFPDKSTNLEKAANIVTESGMMRAGHWRFASGMHANLNADFDLASNNPESLSLVAEMMSDQIIQAVELNNLPTPDVLIGVPKGAETLARAIQPILSRAFSKDLPQLYVTKFPKFRPVKFWVTDPLEQTSPLEQFEDLEGLKILGIEDVTTTWGSTRGALGAISAIGDSFFAKEIKPMAMASFAERQGSDREKPDDPIRISVVDLFVNQWPAEECSDCKHGVPLTENGTPGEPASREEVVQILQGWPKDN